MSSDHLLIKVVDKSGKLWITTDNHIAELVNSTNDGSFTGKGECYVHWYDMGFNFAYKCAKKKAKNKAIKKCKMIGGVPSTAQDSGIYKTWDCRGGIGANNRCASYAIDCDFE